MESLEMKNSDIPTEMIAVILEFFKKKQESECPFLENYSYYFGSSESNHHLYLMELYSSFFRTLVNNEEVRKILSELDKYYQVAYVYSSVYSKIRSSEDKYWLGPNDSDRGITCTFQNLWSNDWIFSRGYFLSRQEFIEDPLIKAIHDKREEMFRNGVNPDKLPPKESWKELLYIIGQAKDQIAKRLQECLLI
jgi:hypothetical protein